MKHAANKPAPGDHNSLVRRNVAIAVKPLQLKIDNFELKVS
jgi:hypothetical protein